ncbi:MAG: NAD-dependent epimerase [Cyclobacteriaceae bacterium]|nr:NAD-dependent epimerase [Cyclobacteriaceae bacterium]
MDRVLVTGAAGFIGYHLAERLLRKGYNVDGLDNINDYYDVSLKYARLDNLKKSHNFHFFKEDMENGDIIEGIFKDRKYKYVINLAAQAGVRYSITNPHTYVKSNIEGFLNILEGCRNTKVKHLIYASSSSVYGANKNMPFSVKDKVGHPLALYAASKRANELMAHAYSSLYNIPTTGLRFFSVYGPFGRPDMALFIFTKAIIEGKPFEVFNNGEMSRDFTYVEDIVTGIEKLLEKIATPDVNWNPLNPELNSSYAPFRLFNIGHGNPIELKEFIRLIEKNVGKKAIMDNKPMQPGDITLNHCDISDLRNTTGYSPSTTAEEGIKKFVDWYKAYYNYNK